ISRVVSMSSIPSEKEKALLRNQCQSKGAGSSVDEKTKFVNVSCTRSLKELAPEGQLLNLAHVLPYVNMPLEDFGLDDRTPPWMQIVRADEARLKRAKEQLKKSNEACNSFDFKEVKTFVDAASYLEALYVRTMVHWLSAPGRRRSAEELHRSHAEFFRLDEDTMRGAMTYVYEHLDVSGCEEWFAYIEHIIAMKNGLPLAEPQLPTITRGQLRATPSSGEALHFQFTYLTSVSSLQNLLMSRPWLIYASTAYEWTLAQFDVQEDCATAEERRRHVETKWEIAKHIHSWREGWERCGMRPMQRTKKDAQGPGRPEWEPAPLGSVFGLLREMRDFRLDAIPEILRYRLDGTLIGPPAARQEQLQRLIARFGPLNFLPLVKKTEDRPSTSNAVSRSASRPPTSAGPSIHHDLPSTSRGGRGKGNRESASTAPKPPAYSIADLIDNRPRTPTFAVPALPRNRPRSSVPTTPSIITLRHAPPHSSSMMVPSSSSTSLPQFPTIPQPSLTASPTQTPLLGNGTTSQLKQLLHEIILSSQSAGPSTASSPHFPCTPTGNLANDSSSAHPYPAQISVPLQSSFATPLAPRMTNSTLAGTPQLTQSAAESIDGSTNSRHCPRASSVTNGKESSPGKGQDENRTMVDQQKPSKMVINKSPNRKRRAGPEEPLQPALKTQKTPEGMVFGDSQSIPFPTPPTSAYPEELMRWIGVVSRDPTQTLAAVLPSEFFFVN
ncbi:hypothetical protein PMAYCL1PPCAC_32481, partial [Pristionchus mayeri]